MRKILTSRLILVAVLFISFSCAKKKDDPFVIPGCKVVSFTNSIEGTGGGPTSSGTVIYGSDGKVQSILNSNGSKRTYTYTGNTVIELEIDSWGVTTYRNVYTIGANGYVSKQVFTDYNFGTPSSFTFTYLCEYDSDGYLTKATYSSPPSYISEETYTYSSGNLISYKDTDGKTTDLDEYEYYTDKEDNGIHYFGVKFGKNSKNLVKKRVYKFTTANSSPSDIYTYTSNYTYTLDAKNNVTKKIENITYTFSSPDVKTDSYVYECN